MDYHDNDSRIKSHGVVRIESGASLKNNRPHSEFGETIQKKIQDENSRKKKVLIRPGTQSKYQKIKRVKQDRRKALTAGQIMSSPVVYLDPDDPVEKARSLFVERRFRHIPIAKKNDELVGVISDRDMFCNVKVGYCMIDGDAFKDPDRKFIKDFMETHVLVADPETEIPVIARILIEERIGSMPIVDDKEKLVGIITRSDILRTLVNKVPVDVWL
jgi:acetoin utilization protein AcuB